MTDSVRVINYFDDFKGTNEHSFLSNFYVDTLTIGKNTFPTGEHAFQAYKANTLKDFARVQRAKSPGEAKSIGRSIELRPDWELVKYDVMRQVLRCKFRPESGLAAMLLETGDFMLVEGTDWNDQVWGVSNKNGSGRNWLGHLLMARRAELRSGFEPLSGRGMSFIKPPFER